MGDKFSALTKKEIGDGFELLRMDEKGVGHYSGAENYAASFKRCSILRDVSTVYSMSTHTED